MAKLKKVSQELANEILNNGYGIEAYGCGSGSGSGSGSGAGCGCGSGDGSGSGNERKYEKIPYSGNFSKKITVTYNQDYEFDVVLSGSFSVYIDRWRKEDEWAMHEERIDMNFDVKGKERRYGYDQEGKPIVYSTSGGSKSFPFSGLRQSCQIDCATTSPEKINLRAELNGELAFHIESTYMGDTHIVLAQKSINCNIYKMR